MMKDRDLAPIQETLWEILGVPAKGKHLDIIYVDKYISLMRGSDPADWVLDD